MSLYTSTWHGGRLMPPKQNPLTGRWQIMLGAHEMFSFPEKEWAKAHAFYSSCMR